jgi:hypothetical protein
MLIFSKFSRPGQGSAIAPLVGVLSLLTSVLLGLPAEASVPLTRADVEALRNRVEFIPRGRNPRAARMSDFLAVGDALRTAATAQADLRFNDGSLARVGERATFRFVPNTRNFRLTNGTVLLLIPPGQGRTNIQTPSAVTGIQGSAVVVRYIPESDLTLVMALTNNPAGPMTITTNGCGNGGADCVANEYALYGGQMALIQNNQVQVVEFDLPMFYQTSPLVEGLELDNPDAESPLGSALEAVRQETLEALDEQAPFSEDSVTLNPAIIGRDGTGQIASDQTWLLSPNESGVSPLSTLNGVLAPSNALVTGVGVGVEGNPGNNNGVVPDGNNGIGVGVGGNPGNNNSVVPGGNNTGANPNPMPNPGAGANPNLMPNPGAGANPNLTPNPGPGANDIEPLAPMPL